MMHRASQIDLDRIRAAAPDALRAAEVLRAAGAEAYLVGGAVRDTLLGRVPKDVDLATNFTPAQVGPLFPFSVPTGIAHGTLTVWMNRTGAGIEITTYRSDDSYSDGRHPDRVHFETHIEADLARRDFTVNAIAADPFSAELVDPYGGREDIAQRVLRAVGDPLARFREDGLRTMRAARFAAQLGFSLDAATRAAIPQVLHIVKKVAPERMRDELVKMLRSEAPSIGLTIMQDTGLFALLLPELPGFSLRIDAAKTEYARWAVLFASSCEVTMRRLRFSSDQCRYIAKLVATAAALPPTGASDGDVRRYVARVGEKALTDALALARANGADTEALAARIPAVLAISKALSISDLAIDGNDLMTALGIASGPRIRVILDALRDAVLDDPTLNTRAALLARCKALP